MRDQYKALYKTYEWAIPHHFNIADVCCHRWNTSPHEARQIAIYFEDQVSQQKRYSYGDLSNTVNQLANAFKRIGVNSGERVLIALDHSPECLISILACATLGAIAVPLTDKLEPEQYQYYIEQTQAKLALADEKSVANIYTAMNSESKLMQVIGVDTTDERIIDWNTLLERQPTDYKIENTLPNTPVMILYDKPETLPTQGRVFTHTCLLGYLPGFVCANNWFPKPRDNMFTFFGWNTPEGLLQAVLPCLYFGRSMIGCPEGRTVPRLFNLLEFYCITHIHARAKDLQKIKNYHDSLHEFALAIRCIQMPYQEINQELRDWVQERFNIKINSYLFTPLFPSVIVECNERWENKENTIGHVTPGFQIALLNKQNKIITEPNKKGKLCVKQHTPCYQQTPGVINFYFEDGVFYTQETANDYIKTDITLSFDKEGYFKVC